MRKLIIGLLIILMILLMGALIFSILNFSDEKVFSPSISVAGVDSSKSFGDSRVYETQIVRWGCGCSGG